MKKWLLHMMFVSVLGMLAASCITDDDLAPYCPQEGKTQVVFTLALNNNGSRAITNPDWDGTYDKEDGVGVDNLINNLQVLFFDNDENGNYIGNVQNAIFYEQSEGVYEFIGEISIDADYVTTNDDGSLNLNAKMMVLANCADITLDENSTYANVQALAYDGATSPSQIPMWGIQAINKPITVGARNELDDIDLLRAMAKVEVIMVAEGYTMQNIILNRYNTKGYSAPGLGGSTWAAVDATADLATEGCMNYNTTATGTDLAVAATDNKIEFYIPECENSTESPLSMYVNIKKGETEVDANLTDAKLYFKDYTDDAPFNIVRNHIYRYTITTVNDGMDLSFTLNVAPWTLVEKNIDYESETISITTEGEGLGWSQIQSTSTTTDKYMMAGVDAVFKFRIDTPLYCEYYVDLSGEGFTITTDSEICVDNTGQPNGATEVTVTISATDDGENHEGILRIFVKEDGRYKEVPGDLRYTIIKNYE